MRFSFGGRYQSLAHGVNCPCHSPLALGLFDRERFGDLMEVARVHADLAEAIGRADEKGASAACDAMTDYAVEFTKKIILDG